jgi:hypothetical protein
MGSAILRNSFAARQSIPREMEYRLKRLKRLDTGSVPGYDHLGSILAYCAITVSPPPSVVDLQG